MRQAIGIALAVILSGSTPLLVSAQSEPDRGPDGQTRTVVPGIDVPSVPGVPFIGTDTIVRTRPIEGGGTVVTTLTAKVLRDAQGRVYRERHHFALPDTDPQKTLYAFYVFDPIAHTRTECTVATHKCYRVGYSARVDFPLQPVGSFDSGKRFLARESLGEQNLENLNLIGTREITTISSGTVGNDRDLTLTREFWYSPELKTNISVTRTDPREGTQAVHLAILSRSEPDPGAFAIPPNMLSWIYARVPNPGFEPMARMIPFLHPQFDFRPGPGYLLATRERRMVQPMKIDSNSCTTVREVTEA